MTKKNEADWVTRRCLFTQQRNFAWQSDELVEIVDEVCWNKLMISFLERLLSMKFGISCPKTLLVGDIWRCSNQDHKRGQRQIESNVYILSCWNFSLQSRQFKRRMSWKHGEFELKNLKLFLRLIRIQEKHVSQNVQFTCLIKKEK